MLDALASGAASLTWSKSYKGRLREDGLARQTDLFVASPVDRCKSPSKPMSWQDGAESGRVPSHQLCVEPRPSPSLFERRLGLAYRPLGRTFCRARHAARCRQGITRNVATVRTALALVQERAHQT